MRLERNLAPAMEPETLYQHLENLARRLGIEVRYDDLSDPELNASSGLCTIMGRSLYIMDRSRTLAERIHLLGTCLANMDLEGVYLVPAVRRLLERGRREDGRGRREVIPKGQEDSRERI